VRLRLGDLWRYRELVYFLVWRDGKGRYKQTAIGGVWALLQPTLLALLFAVVFGRLAHLPSDGVPYLAFAYAGLLPWMLFATALIESSTSLVTNKDLITKVYFPRLTVPIASVLAATVDFLIGGIGIVILLLAYGITPTIALLTLPLFVLLAIFSAFAVGIWLAALNVEYRDVQYTIPFLTQAWLFATPIAYSVTLIPERYRWVYGLNPMAAVVTGFRWALFGKSPAPSPVLGVGLGALVVLLVTGVAYFRRVERSFADIV
jgi:lipopolysaccharide transport system permease protein